VALHHVYAFDQDPVAPGQNFYDAAALAFVFAGDYSDPVILANINLYVHTLDSSAPVFKSLLFKSLLFSNHFRGQAHNLHEALLAQLSRHWPEYAGPHGLVIRFDEHGRILIESNVCAVPPARLFSSPHDYRSNYLTLLDRPIRSSFFNGGSDYVAQTGSRARVAPDRQYHGDAFRP
jgi:hypothetical protein